MAGDPGGASSACVLSITYAQFSAWETNLKWINKHSHICSHGLRRGSLATWSFPFLFLLPLTSTAACLTNITMGRGHLPLAENQLPTCRLTSRKTLPKLPDVRGLLCKQRKQTGYGLADWNEANSFWEFISSYPRYCKARRKVHTLQAVLTTTEAILWRERNCFWIPGF